MDLKTVLFSFDGRMRRRDWWLASIGLFVFSLLLTETTRWMLFGPEYAMMAPGRVSWSAVLSEPRVQILTAVLTVLMTWPHMAIAAKRAHDRNLGAASVIALLAVTCLWDIASAFVANQPSAFTGGLIGQLINGVIGLYLFVVLGCLDGTRGPNRFGRSPKGIGGEPADEAAKVFS